MAVFSSVDIRQRNEELAKALTQFDTLGVQNTQCAKQLETVQANAEQVAGDFDKARSLVLSKLQELNDIYTDILNRGNKESQVAPVARPVVAPAVPSLAQQT